jgi:hypothetical protein
MKNSTHNRTEKWTNAIIIVIPILVWWNGGGGTSPKASHIPKGSYLVDQSSSSLKVFVFTIPPPP